MSSRRRRRRMRRRYARMSATQQRAAAVIIGGVILFAVTKYPHPPAPAAPATTTAVAGIGGRAGPVPGRLLTSGQQQFGTTFASLTGLDPRVIAAWEAAEESGSYATGRQAANNQDWLNVGYTDTATYGAADAIWGDPVTAAQATAGWMKGQNTVPGFGRAAPGVRAILTTAGQSPAAQISAIQGSGWASSGYPDLPSLYQQAG